MILIAESGCGVVKLHDHLGNAGLSCWPLRGSWSRGRELAHGSSPETVGTSLIAIYWRGVLPRYRSKSWLRDLLEVRRIIEPMAAGLAAERGRLERVSEIENAYWQMEAAGDNTEESIGPDIRFHQAILEASGNELLVPLGAVIAAALESSIKLSSSTPGVQIKSLPFHKSILDAIKQRDPPGARRAMERLLSETVSDIDAELRSGRNRRIR